MGYNTVRMPTLKRVLTFNPRLCDGCGKCVEACMSRVGEFRGVSAIKLIKGDDGRASVAFCLQCDQPFCRVICPTGSVLFDEIRGVSFIRRESCVGCRSCSMICPAEAVAFDDLGKAVKCDLCDGDPLCVKVCDRGALKYAAAEELSSSKKDIVALLISSSNRVGALATNRGLAISEALVGDATLFSQMMSVRSEGLRRFLDYCSSNLLTISREASLATLSETVLKRRRSLGLSELRRPKEEVQTLLKALSFQKGGEAVG